MQTVVEVNLCFTAMIRTVVLPVILYGTCPGNKLLWSIPSCSGSDSDSADRWTSSAFFNEVSNFLTNVLGKSLLFSHVLSESGYPYKIVKTPILTKNVMKIRPMSNRRWLTFHLTKYWSVRPAPRLSKIFSISNSVSVFPEVVSWCSFLKFTFQVQAR